MNQQPIAVNSILLVLKVLQSKIFQYSETTVTKFSCRSQNQLAKNLTKADELAFHKSSFVRKSVDRLLGRIFLL